MIGIELQLVEERIHLLTYLLTYLLTHLLTQPAVIGIELVVIHVGIQGIPIPLLVLRTLGVHTHGSHGSHFFWTM